MAKGRSWSVVAALLAGLVIVLTLFGALDDLDTWLRALIQSIGSLAGIFLGAHLQGSDDEHVITRAGRPAFHQLVALAGSMDVLIRSCEAHLLRLSTSPPATIKEATASMEAFVAGVDTHTRGMYGHARAAAEAWAQFLPGEALESPMSSASDVDGGTP